MTSDKQRPQVKRVFVEASLAVVTKCHSRGCCGNQKPRSRCRQGWIFERPRELLSPASVLREMSQCFPSVSVSKFPL